MLKEILFTSRLFANGMREFGYNKIWLYFVLLFGSSVHERQLQLGPPIRTATPYGARLTWKLPGATVLVVHLKDRQQIRHKKRWSQVRIIVNS